MDTATGAPKSSTTSLSDFPWFSDQSAPMIILDATKDELGGAVESNPREAGEYARGDLF